MTDLLQAAERAAEWLENYAQVTEQDSPVHACRAVYVARLAATLRAAIEAEKAKPAMGNPITEEMLEAAARSLCASEGHKDLDTLICPGTTGPLDDPEPRPRWTFYKDEAKSALAAALVSLPRATLPLEPSEEAIDEAAVVFWGTEPGISHRAAIRSSLRRSYAIDLPALLAAEWAKGREEGLREARALWVENIDDNFGNEISRRIGDAP